MQHSFIVGDFLLPADEYAPEAIHPRMSSLAYPTPGSIARTLEFAFAFLAPGKNMRFVAAFDYCLKNVSVIVTFIQAHMLKNDFMLLRKHLLTVKRLLDQTLIVRVGAGDGQSNRYPVAVGLQASLGA